VAFLTGFDVVTVAFFVGDLAGAALAVVALVAGAAFLAGAADFVPAVVLVTAGAFLAGATFLALADDFFTAVNSTSFGDGPLAPPAADCGTPSPPPITSMSG